ncbi:Hypothetical protein, putative [Bodo saltans]|uniref:Uncharacterized protein n=1 Tax=Bodo saltans TaxID=75058 RepID=A0A0S4JS92_BODSA|nr:Hypothetical protein, putative [Bodo saltans]|eukprot:CUG93106.1 Hypothetical protein, putative [Bodo saltans]
MSRAESTTSVITEQGGLFVRNDQVVEELDLYVEYLLQPVHCIRICSELASVQLASAVYEQVAVQAYNDHLMTTSKELIGPLPAPTKKYDITAFSKPSGNGHERVGAPIDALPSMMVRFFDQCPDDMAATTLETNVLLAIREVVTRLYGWTLWEVDKVPWTRERHACLAEDILFNVLADQKKLGGGSSSTSAANGAIVAAAGGGIVFSKSHEVTRMHFTKRVDVIREVDITEQVLQQQEERAFRDKQAKLRQDQLRTQRYYSLLCSAGTPLDRRLASVQLWLDGIEKQEIKSIFIDSARRTVLHWIVDWSEEAYAKNRLGGDLLRSHIFFALELGISPLQLDGTNRTAMTIATSKKHPKPRANFY